MLKKRLTYGITYSAVEHNTDVNNKEKFILLRLTRKGKELIIKERNSSSDFNKIISLFKKQQHLFLVVNNHQVLSKEIDALNESPELTAKKAFPSIVLKDFYYEVCKIEAASFISICRKEYIDDLIENYNKNRISVVGFSLGNLAIQNVLPFIDYKEIQTSTSKLEVENHQLKSIEKNNDEVILNYSINDLEITNKELLPLGGILTYYLEKENQLGLNKKNKELRENHFQKQLFSQGLKSGLVFLFLILLLNVLIFSRYHSENNKLIAEVQLNESYKNQLLKIQSEIDKKEKVIANLSSVSKSRVSLYLDEIAILVPNTILLTDIKYQPLTTRLKKDKQLVVHKNKLQVKGVISNNEDVTYFIRSLERKEWISEVIIELGKDKKKTTFEILIHINDE